eukprot:CAMPEP_0172297268 /NCGR_PEP_ID=MMETSP1058-20130122/356_1 /TAXON_ID=83371 /ORGANISM="Detonula confervacea, Strain CCMP 353" /LENGTH=252 /DNA_ID=CAMNT_0013006397 /DNA_START=1 /DNA_END=759 /DNA_ORIENTATION=-
MNNRTSVAVLLGTVAAALHNSADAFAPRISLRLRLSPSASSGEGCRCTTEASLFRRKKKIDAAVELDPSPQQTDEEDESNQLRNSRRSFLSATAATASLLPLRAYAAMGEGDKQLNLSNDDLKQIILSDIVDKSFLVSADITRSVYDESATFTDEIDVYTMDKWIKGTKALFIPSGSRVSLVGDVEVSPTEVSFRFDEDLMFNIPFKPVCSLTGKMVLTRDQNTGLITSYREYWDQSVNDVLKTAKFGKKAQ